MSVSSLNNLLANGKKPTYKIEKDVSNLSLQNILAILHTYQKQISKLNNMKRRKDDDSDEEDMSKRMRLFTF